MDVLELLVGKKMLIMTDMKVEVELEIEFVKQNNHSRDLEESTQANDWWPATEDWSTFTVKFTNGAYKEYRSINEIDII